VWPGTGWRCPGGSGITPVRPGTTGSAPVGVSGDRMTAVAAGDRRRLVVPSAGVRVARPPQSGRAAAVRSCWSSCSRAVPCGGAVPRLVRRSKKSKPDGRGVPFRARSSGACSVPSASGAGASARPAPAANSAAPSPPAAASAPMLPPAGARAPPLPAVDAVGEPSVRSTAVSAVSRDLGVVVAPMSALSTSVPTTTPRSRGASPVSRGASPVSLVRSIAVSAALGAPADSGGSSVWSTAVAAADGTGSGLGVVVAEPAADPPGATGGAGGPAAGGVAAPPSPTGGASGPPAHRRGRRR
jgi:hypothetical protein